MSWENNVYVVEAAPPRRVDPVVKMALTPSAYRNLPENVEGHIAEFLLPRKIPAQTRGMKYRLPQKILSDRLRKKEIQAMGKEYMGQAEKRAYNQYMANIGRAEMNAAIASERAIQARLEADAAEAEARRLATEAAEAAATSVEPLSPVTERKKQVAQSRARRGKTYNLRMKPTKPLNTFSEKAPRMLPFKKTRKSSKKGLNKQNFNVYNDSME